MKYSGGRDDGVRSTRLCEMSILMRTRKFFGL
jgi:hypothetical protein